MPNQLIEYRLRIRNASTSANPNGTADVIDVTSVRSGTNPYITEPPSGDGAEFDPITGRVRTGSYNVMVADAVVGATGTGPLRMITQNLEDAQYRQQLLSRRAYVEMRTNAGAWTQLIAGYVLAIRLVNATTYEVNIGDTRRIESSRSIFTNNTLGAISSRGCLTGGPITNTWGPVVSRGGWRYRAQHSGTPYVLLQFEAGYDSYTNAPLVTDWRRLVREPVIDVIESYYALPSFTNGDWGYPGITLHVGTTQTNGAATNHTLLYSPYGATYGRPGYGPLQVYWDGALPTNNSIVYVSLYTNEVTEACPLYIDAHPVDVVLAVWNDAGIYYKNPADADPAWIASLRNAIGTNTRLACRFTEPQTITEFLDESVFGPFGLAVRTNQTTGAQELFDTRGRSNAVPSVSITAADMTSGDDMVFDLDENTIVSSVSLTMKSFSTLAVTQQQSAGQLPTDGVIVSDVKVVGNVGDVAPYASGREVSFSIPGMIHSAESWMADASSTALSIGNQLAWRFGRGAQASEVSLLKTATAASLQVGEEVVLQAPHFPSANYRIGEAPSVGGRVMQVVRRTETPSGPQLRLLDVGVSLSSLTTPVVSVRQSPTTGPYVAEFKIDNAAQLTTDYAAVEVQWLRQSTLPASTTGGNVIKTYSPLEVPSDWVPLPAVNAGENVYVRARAQQYQKRWTPWSAWVGASLTAVSAPGVLTLSGITSTAVTLSWTNTNTDWPIGIFLYPGVTAPADWSAYRYSSVIAGTTSSVIRDIATSGISYVVGIAYDTPTGYSTFRTAAFTPTGAGTTLLRPAALSVVPSASDASLLEGVVLALWASNQVYDIVIERAPDAGGSPGTAVEIAVVSGSTTTYIDPLPADGLLYHYRIAHRYGGFTQSAWTPWVVTSAGGVPFDAARPSAQLPTITPQTTGSASSVEVVIDIVDTQKRIDVVQFRTSYHGGAYTAWTTDASAPYSASVATLNDGITSKVGWRVLGFDANNAYVTLREGESAWPLQLGTNPTENRLTRSRYNAATGRYEVWHRYFLPLGNGQLQEDPTLGFVTIHGVVVSSIKDQNGNGINPGDFYVDPVKQADGWFESWPSTATQSWTFQLSSYGLFEELIFPSQDSDYQVTPFPAVAGSSTFNVAASVAGGTEPWAQELIEVAWDAPAAESGNAREVLGRCYDLYNVAFNSNVVYVTCVVTDSASDFEPSATATISAAPVSPVGELVAGGGTATAVFKTNSNGQFKIRVSETAAANRYIWVRSGGHMQVYVKARDGILELQFT
jgi:tetrahydromethanopterin S-methyltransferase subunit F